MTHYLKFENGEKYQVEMYCNNPNKTSETRCYCDCSECRYGIASTDIRTMLKLIRDAKADRLS